MSKREGTRQVGTEGLGLWLGWEAPRARSSDPQTSKDAAQSMVDGAEAQRQKILAYLQVHAGGATADTLDRELGWRPSTAGRRLSELIESGQVVRCDGLPHGKLVPPKLTQKTRQGRYAFLHIHVSHLDPSWIVGP